MDGLRGDEHHPRARVAQADEEEEQPLLVEAGPRQLAQLGLVEGQRGHDHRGVGLLVPVHQRLPHLVQPRLEQLEARELVLGGQVGRKRRLQVHRCAQQYRVGRAARTARLGGDGAGRAAGGATMSSSWRGTGQAEGGRAQADLADEVVAQGTHQA